MASERVFAPTPLVGAGGRIITAPFQFVTTGEDSLRVTVVNSAANVRVAIQGRRLDADGIVLPLAYVVVPTADRISTTRIFPLGVGAVVNLAVWASSGAPQPGQTFVVVQIVRGSTGGVELLGTLLQGYVTSTQGLGWPGSPIISSTDGEPALRTIAGTQPAAGAPITETVPTGARWELLAIRFSIATSADPATRYVFVYGLDSGVAPWQVLSPRTIGPTEVRAYNFAVGLESLVNDVVGIAQSGLPDRVLLRSGAQVLTSIVNLHSGDQLSAPSFQVREWLEVP